MASPNAKPSWVSLEADPAQKERQDKIIKLVHSQMMDFKLYNPHKLATCVEKLLQLFDNICKTQTNRSTERQACCSQQYTCGSYCRLLQWVNMQVRGNNATFKRDVLDVTKQSEELVLAAGWHSQVLPHHTNTNAPLVSFLYCSADTRHHKCYPHSYGN